MGVYVFHVQVMNVVLQTPPLPSHHTVLVAPQIRHHVVLVNRDITIQEGHVFHVNQMNAVIQGTEVISFHIVIHAVQT